MSGEDELDEIFVDENQPADKKIVVEILKGLVTIDSKGIIEFSDEGEKLKYNRKVLIYLVCKKALVLKGIIKPEEEFSGPKEISEKMSLGLSSAKRATNVTFKKLLKSKKGKYIIPNYNLKKIKKVIFEAEIKNVRKNKK